ncbi:hypothetical protein K7X08_007521 [Anisodus acutangulus]|uniref:Uncharacterized protein n=1 Tax=Anisodus acutangulus TaxID=402998 RepID=A0A9Q1QYC6_9SOLA|nr:hypothetical protein K7X08_007521 [Anisodus acutangulus]
MLKFNTQRPMESLQRVNFLKEMDLSIWDPPENPDVIEEDALNEKSCVQVLNILIKKADSEIAELEDDILMLQRQLACEDDMRFAELNKKIVNLDNMLRTLKE